MRGGARTVELYTADHQLVATHTRASSPGERQTQLDHLPPEKVPGLLLTREACRAQAVAIGPATTDLLERLLEQRPLDRLRVAGRVLRLAQTFSATRLERACARATHFGVGDYPTVKRILQEGLEGAPLAPAATGAESAGGTLATATTATTATTAATPATGRYTFVRQASEFVAGLLAASAVAVSAVRVTSGAHGGGQ